MKPQSTDSCIAIGILSVARSPPLCGAFWHCCLNAPFLGAFLDHIESARTNGARSRNLRLTAVRSFFRYAALESPHHSVVIQRVLAIPNKRQPRPLVGFLTRPEIDALLAAPDRQTWLGRRDHALLLTAVP